MTPEKQRAKRRISAADIELAKEQTPSTSLFVWFIPAFLALAWMCKTDAGREIAQAIPEVNLAAIRIHHTPYHPSEETENSLYLAGWKLF